MACPHASGCPLFPLMKESLNAWRQYYCDSSSGWQQCARYIRSNQGEVVPLGLLPNGRHAQHIQTHAGAAAPEEPAPATLASLPPLSGAAVPVGTAPPGTPASVRTLPDGETSPGRFEPMRTFGRPHTAVPSTAPSVIPQQRISPETAPPRTDLTVRRPRRRWWTRLMDWMKGSDE